jgi:mycofactocin precursor
VTPLFRFGTRCHILAKILTGSTRLVETLITKGDVMEPNQQTETDTELVTESLVEEVSIDGMCGVY